MIFDVLYRGPLSSCNYGCRYCPFSKRTETPAQLDRDRRSLALFTDWLALQSDHRWTVLFTPWGEALVRRWYRDAVTRISHLDHLESVAVQTNLSCALDWVANCRADRLVFWATYHPSECAPDRFTRQIERLLHAGVRVSVGTVGAPDALPQIEDMRRRLPPDVYLWINAQQPRPRPYTSAELAAFTAIDPHFQLTAAPHRSRGRSCRAGELSFTVDGSGDMRRCHFVDPVIGNIYDPEWQHALQPRTCPNQFCNCFLGISQLEAAALHSHFSPTPLHRLPLHL